MIKRKPRFFLIFPSDKLGEKEIQRQNRITAQIVANYLERRLFPFKRPTHRLPTVDEILPAASPQNSSESKTKFTRHLDYGGLSGTATGDDDESQDDEYFNSDDNNEQDLDPNEENLQSVESNHVDSFYSEMNGSINNESEGRFYLFFFSNLLFVDECWKIKPIFNCKIFQPLFHPCIMKKMTILIHFVLQTNPSIPRSFETVYLFSPPIVKFQWVKLYFCYNFLFAQFFSVKFTIFC